MMRLQEAAYSCPRICIRKDNHLLVSKDKGSSKITMKSRKKSEWFTMISIRIFPLFYTVIEKQ